MRYRNTSNVEQYIPAIEKVVGAGEEVESEVVLSGAFVAVPREAKKGLPANPEDVN